MTGDQRHTGHIATGQQLSRHSLPTLQYFLFSPPHIFFNSILTSLTNGTFDFVRHTSRYFAKPKEPFLPMHPKTHTIFANICQDNIIIMATQFGERIRELRTKQNILLRQLASQLDVDTSIISKVERGDRQLKKEQIPLLAEILKASSDELMTLWLADPIYEVVKDEKMANKAMQVAEKKINLKQRKK